MMTDTELIDWMEKQLKNANYRHDFAIGGLYIGTFGPGNNENKSDFRWLLSKRIEAKILADVTKKILS